MIYFDNAATTINKPQEVIDAVVNAMQNCGNSGRGVNDASLLASMEIYEARCIINDFFNGYGAENTVFTSNATEALNLAMNGILGPHDHVITTIMEHNSVLRPLNYLKDIGLQVDYVEADKNGNLNYDQFSSFVKKNTKAIIMNHCSNVTGNFFDIDQVGKIAFEHNLAFIVDAAQSAGLVDINMKNSNIDVLCFTGHKSLLGPQGTGGLCVNPKINIRATKSGGTGIQSFNSHQPDQLPSKLEAGTLNAHGIAGLASAVKYINKVGLSNLRKQELETAKYFYEKLTEIDDITTYGDFTSFDNRAAIVSFNLKDLDSGIVSDKLSTNYGICIRSGAHCAPLVHKHFGTEDRGMVRFSFSAKNTKAEVDVAIDALNEINSL